MWWSKMEKKIWNWIERVKEAEERYLESWKGFHLKRLELEWQKAVRVVVMETVVVEETGKKKFPNADARKAGLAHQFKKEDENMVEMEFQMKMKLAEWSMEKKRVEVLMIGMERWTDEQKKEMEEFWEKEYVSNEPRNER